MATSKKIQPEKLPEPEAVHWRARLRRDVRAASIKPPMTKSEAMTYFQSRWPGNWNQRLSQALQPFLPLTKSGKEQSIKNIERRHQARKGKGVPAMTARTKSEYEALGASIGYAPPKYGYHVEFDGWIAFSSVCERRSSEDINVVGEWAAQVAADPSLMLDALLLIYMEEDDQSREIGEQQPSVGFCEDGDTGEAGEPVQNPRITIKANERERHSGHGGQKRRFSFFDKR